MNFITSRECWNKHLIIMIEVVMNAFFYVANGKINIFRSTGAIQIEETFYNDNNQIII